MVQDDRRGRPTGVLTVSLIGEGCPAVSFPVK